MLHQAWCSCQSISSNLHFSCSGANAHNSPLMIEFWQVSAPQHSSEAAPLSCCFSCCKADMKHAWKSEKLCCTSRNWIHCKAQRLTEKGICFNFYSPLLLLEAEAFIWVDSVSGGKGGRLQIFLPANSQTLAWAFSPGLAEAGADWAQVDLHHQLLLRYTSSALYFAASKN